MAIAANSQSTHVAIGNREDLADVIYDVTPEETPLLSSIARVTASGIKHEVQTGALRAAAANEKLEGESYTNVAPTQNVRVINYCSISHEVAETSGTQEAVTSAGRSSDHAHEMIKSMKEIKLDRELMLFANTAYVAGNATLARKHAGLQAYVLTNVDDASDATASAGTGADIHTDGTARAVTESMVSSVLGTGWSNGANPSIGYMNKAQKQAFAEFSGNQTRTLDGATKKITNSVDIYVDPLGTEIRIIPARQCPADVMYFIDPEFVAMATMRDFQSEVLAKTSDSTREAIVFEGCLEMRNQKAHCAIYDLS